MSSRSAKTSMFTTAVTGFAESKETEVPQSAPLKGQKKNHAGGYSYEVTPETYARRVIVMGTTSPTYYSTAKQLTTEAAQFMAEQVDAGNGMMILDVLRSVQDSHSAPKMDMTMAVLGFLTRCSDDAVRKAALEYTVPGLRTFSQRYSWLKCHMASGKGKGFGRGPKRAIQQAILALTPKQLAYQGTKYPQREGIAFSHILDLAHPKPTKTKRPKTIKVEGVDGSAPEWVTVEGSGGTTAGYSDWPLGTQVVLAYVKHGFAKALQRVLGGDYTPAVPPTHAALEAMLPADLDTDTKEVLAYLWSVDTVKAEDVAEATAVELVNRHNLPREVLATKLLNSEKIWQSLLLRDTADPTKGISMPITALFRNLGKISALGMLDTSTGTGPERKFTSQLVEAICGHITNPDVVVRGHVHPAQVITALKTYRNGRGLRGSLTWTASPDVVKALDSAIDVAFHTIESTGYDEMHFLDISGSMTMGNTGVEGMAPNEAMSIQLLCSLRAALRSDTPSRQIVGIFDTVGRIVYDSAKPKDSVFGLNKTIREDLKALYTELQPKTPSTSSRYGGYYGGLYGSYGGYGSKPTETTANLFDPTCASYGTMWSTLSRFPMGGTDCAQPMLVAILLAKKYGVKVRNLYVYTDNETWAGAVHPAAALREYRKYVPGARLTVVAATPTKFSIADPKDPGMLDVSGWDVGAGTVMHDFNSAE